MTIQHRQAGPAAIAFDPDDGCRLTSLVVAGHELLWHDTPAPWPGGCFVMAPFAGRIRDGVARWSGQVRRYPTHADGHAQHGLVLGRPWAQVSDDIYAIHLDDDEWFGPCTVRQLIVLTDKALHLDLEVVAQEPVPATIGWHPWFRRQLDGADLQLTVDADQIRTKDARGITTRTVAPVPPGPWDDTFDAVRWPTLLRWPGVLDLEIVSDAPVAVVFTERDDAVCVEPQSGPPDEVNHPQPRLATPTAPVRLSTTWRWYPAR